MVSNENGNANLLPGTQEVLCCPLSSSGQELCTGNLPKTQLHLCLQESVHGPWTRAGHLWENTQSLKIHPASFLGPPSRQTPPAHLSELLEGKGHTMPLSPVDIGEGPLTDLVALIEVFSCLDDICLTPEKPVSRQTQKLFLLGDRCGGAEILRLGRVRQVRFQGTRSILLVWKLVRGLLLGPSHGGPWKG